MDDLRQLGRYQLQRVLGRGAMGVVYEGVDPKLNRQVAVKLILKSNINDPALEAEYSARFIREAQAVARLNHPNIVTVFDFGDENDVAFLVMELIQGKELKDYFDDKKAFGLDDAVRMIGELLDALDYAHQNGIVHRDIKPANVMLDGQMRVKLTDFGVARLSDAGADRTQAGTMVGTPSYMSPEQIEGLPVGPRSDIFAVGIILYQFLTGEKPFHAQGLWAIQKKIMQEDPVLPSVLNPSINPAFDAVILRALAKKADDRYPTAGAFKDELKRALAGDNLEDSDSTRLVLRPQTAASGAAATRPPGTQPGIGGTGTGTNAAYGTGTSAGNNAGGGTNVGDATAGLEIEFWRSIKDSDDAEEFALYIQRFPNGSYVDLAKRKLAKLRGESSNSLKPPFNTAANATGTNNGTNAGNRTGAGNTNVRPQAVDHDATNPGATPASGKKWLIPAAAAGVLAVAGIGFVLMSGGDKAGDKAKPEQASASQAASIPVPTPTPQVASVPAQPDPAQVEAEKVAARKAEEEKQKLADDLAKKTKELEELKKAAANDPAKQAEIAKKQEEKEAARKLADEQAKKRAEEMAIKKKAAEDAKKEQALVDARKLEDAKKAEDARKAELAKKQETEKREADARAAAATRATPTPAAAVATPAPGGEENQKSASALLADARNLEASGKMKEAVRVYKQAANAGSGQAAKRAGDILAKGEGGMARDYGESLKWYGKARSLGVEVQGIDKKD